MRKIEFYDVEDFCFEVDKMYTDFGGNLEYDIAIIAKYDEAREIIKYLTSAFTLYDIQICPPEINGYSDEYIISINDDGLWCEPAKSEKEYLYDESTVTYIMENCSSAVLPHLGGVFKFEVCIHEFCKDEECICDCATCGVCPSYEEDLVNELDCAGCCDLCDCKETVLDIDDDLRGFSISESNENGSYSFSFHSTDKELVDCMLNAFR